MTSTRANSGFTLVEVLVAMAITVMVMAAVTTSFTATLESQQVVQSLGESTEAGPRILDMVERDVRGLWHHNIKGNSVLRGRNMDVLSIEADRIDMLTTTDSVGYVLDSHGRQLRPSVCEVGYWLKPHPRYNDLMELWRREDPLVDGELLTEGSFQLVHDRLKSFKITYFRSLGVDAEELLEWDSASDGRLPRRMKIEFTLERKRGSVNLVSDAEVADFEGAEKTYVRHIVFDPRLVEILRPGVAMVPVLPPAPEQDSSGGGGGDDRGGGGGGGGGANPFDQMNQAGGRQGNNANGTRTTTITQGDGKGQGRPTGGNRPSAGPGGGSRPPGGFNLADLFAGAQSGGDFSGLFGGGR